MKSIGDRQEKLKMKMPLRIMKLVEGEGKEEERNKERKKERTKESTKKRTKERALLLTTQGIEEWGLIYLTTKGIDTPNNKEA